MQNYQHIIVANFIAFDWIRLSYICNEIRTRYNASQLKIPLNVHGGLKIEAFSGDISVEKFLTLKKFGMVIYFSTLESRHPSFSIFTDHGFGPMTSRSVSSLFSTRLYRLLLACAIPRYAGFIV